MFSIEDAKAEAVSMAERLDSPVHVIRVGDSSLSDYLRTPYDYLCIPFDDAELDDALETGIIYFTEYPPEKEGAGNNGCDEPNACADCDMC